MDPTRSVAKPDQMRQLMKHDPNVVVMYSHFVTKYFPLILNDKKLSPTLRKALAGKRVTFYGVPNISIDIMAEDDEDRVELYRDHTFADCIAYVYLISDDGKTMRVSQLSSDLNDLPVGESSLQAVSIVFCAKDELASRGPLPLHTQIVTMETDAVLAAVLQTARVKRRHELLFSETAAAAAAPSTSPSMVEFEQPFPLITVTIPGLYTVSVQKVLSAIRTNEIILPTGPMPIDSEHDLLRVGVAVMLAVVAANYVAAKIASVTEGYVIESWRLFQAEFRVFPPAKYLAFVALVQYCDEEEGKPTGLVGNVGAIRLFLVYVFLRMNQGGLTRRSSAYYLYEGEDEEISDTSELRTAEDILQFLHHKETAFFAPDEPPLSDPKAFLSQDVRNLKSSF